MPTIHFPRWIVEQLIEQAQQSSDTEICGLLGARHGQPATVYAITNIADNPERHFLLDAKQQIDAMRSMRDNNETLFAIYHSHPNGSPEPSSEDIEKATYPDALYLIISMASIPQINGFYLKEGKVQPANIVLE